MEVDFDAWKKHLSEFSENNSGVFTIVKTPVYGDRYELFTSEVKLQFKNNTLCISQTATKVDYANCNLSPLTITYHFKKESNYYLTLNKRDFFDRLSFGGRIRTENLQFDKKYTINSSDKMGAYKLFSDIKVQNIFIDNPLLVFNISTSNGITEFKIKHMANKQYSHLEMKKALEEAQFLLSKIL